MTENQTKEMFNLLTKSVSGIQRLEKRVGSIEIKVDKIEKDVAVLKSDVAVLKTGQIKIEKEVHLNTYAINEVLGEQFRLRIRMVELENASA